MKEGRGIGVAQVDLVPKYGSAPALKIGAEQRCFAGPGGSREPDQRPVGPAVEQPKQPLACYAATNPRAADLRHAARGEHGNRRRVGQHSQAGFLELDAF